MDGISPLCPLMLVLVILVPLTLMVVLGAVVVKEPPGPKRLSALIEAETQSKSEQPYE